MVKTAPPDLKQVKRQQVRVPQGDYCVTVEYPVSIEGAATATLTEVFSLSLAKEILSLSAGGAEAVDDAFAQAPSTQPSPGRQAPRAAQQQQQPNFGGQSGYQQTFGQAFGGSAQGPGAAPPNVQPVQFANLQPVPMGAEQGNIGLLMDVYMEMSVELGRTRKRIKDILGIGEGTIIELDKLAGEPVDILVNHKLIAKGEVVVIDENFGVRVTEIVSQIDRMNELT
jgi:flagellar motor switch protein FliN/FliY